VLHHPARCTTTAGQRHKPGKAPAKAATGLSHHGGKVRLEAASNEELVMSSIDLGTKTFTDETLHSACFIDESGREVPITPEMIDSACRFLADTFRVPPMTTRQMNHA